jgi:hypothetical protein
MMQIIPNSAAVAHAVPFAPGPTRCPKLVCLAFVAIFALHALNYAHFFVDDEAIPFVYAQNLLDTHRLAYNPDDGPVEGYSDFLSIWIDLAVLGMVRELGASRLWVFAFTKLLAFLCGMGLIVVTCRVLTRQFPDRRPVVAGMVFIVLAGPLAVWSMSGMETTMFALFVATLVAGLLDADRPDARVERVILVGVVGMLLCRIDGFVWVGALLLPFLVSVGRARRRQLLTRVVLPAGATFLAYGAWRVWYFGEILPMPVYAKVLYKLGGHRALVSNDPPERYVIAFLRAYRWLPAALLGLAVVRAGNGSRSMRALAVGIVLVTAYLWVVGDWMFGFRFFVPLLAPLAFLAGAAFEGFPRRFPRAAATALVVWTLALGTVAHGFWLRYEGEQRRGSWLAEPGIDPARFFRPFYQVYKQASLFVKAGDTIAYNQAGFVPFMLGARNIDDLGVCTKFYAKLPTTDIVFTEVGRYSPLTGSPALRASEVYTLARAPRLLLVPADNIRSANQGAIPPRVLGGAYRLLYRTRTVAAYVPDGPLPPPAGARGYLENLAHTSHLREAWAGGRLLAQSEYLDSLRYLRGGRARLRFDGTYAARLMFSAADEDVCALEVGGITSAGAAAITLRLVDHRGRTVVEDRVQLAVRDRRNLHVELEPAVRAAALFIDIVGAAPGPQAVDLEDLRVQGQSAALKRFVRDYGATN